LVSSAFASRLISVLATTEAAVFFFMVCMLPFNVLALSFSVRYYGQIKERGMGGVC
jgi:predicted membrane protein